MADDNDFDSKANSPRSNKLQKQKQQQEKNIPKKKVQSFTKDFIVVSEFSELEGPVPLLVVPQGGEQHFNINHMVVRIMAVDTQKSADIMHSAQDTQVVLTDTAEEAFIYVHHLTLLDICARGYVRPICISFITHDPKKIMSNFQTFVREFSTVSNILKAGNREVFDNDLKARMLDAQFTQNALNRNPQLVLAQTALEDAGMVNEYMKDLRNVYKRLHSTSPSTILSPFMQKYSEREGATDEEEEEEEISTRSTTPSNQVIENQTAPSNQVIENQTTASQSSIPASQTASKSTTTSESHKSLDSYQPKLLTALHKNAYYNKPQLRPLSELCTDTVFKNAMETLSHIHLVYSRPNLVLSLAQDDEEILYPSSSLLTMGKIIQLNFHTNPQKEHKNATLEDSKNDSRNNSGIYHSSSSSDSYFSPLSSSPPEEHKELKEFAAAREKERIAQLSNPVQDSQISKHAIQHHQTHTTNTHAHLQTPTHSQTPLPFFTPQLHSISQSPNLNSNHNNVTPTLSRTNMNNNNNNSSDSNRIAAASPLLAPSELNSIKDIHSITNNPTTTANSSPSLFINVHSNSTTPIPLEPMKESSNRTTTPNSIDSSLTIVKDNNRTQTPDSQKMSTPILNNNNLNANSNTNVNITNNETSKQTTNHQAPPKLNVTESHFQTRESSDSHKLKTLNVWPRISHPKSPTLHSFASLFWDFYNRPMVGKGILEASKKYVWFKHFVFSILKGRPVVIHGSDETGIRHLVQIGALFLAGHWGKQVPHFPRRSNSFTTLPPANFSSTTTTTSTTTNTNSTPTSPNNNTNNNNSNTQNQQTSSAPSSSNSSYSSSFSVKLASDGVLVNEEIPFCCFWLEQNLKLSHLSHFRLIGLSKDFSIPKSVERYVSIVNFDQETFCGPAYSSDARLVEDLIGLRRQWPNEETLLAWIEWMLLEIGNKASMYYHLCCVGVPEFFENHAKQPSSGTSSTPGFNLYKSQTFGQSTNPNNNNNNAKRGGADDPKKSYSDSNLRFAPNGTMIEHWRNQFISEFNSNDLEIIEHLAELVKKQQVLETSNIEKSAPIITLDFSPVMKFKNLRK